MVKGLKKLAQKALKAIKKIAQAVVKVIKKAVELAKKALKSLAKALVDAVKAIAAVVVDVVKRAVTALKYSIKMIMEVGMALLKGDFVGVLRAIFVNAIKAVGADPKRVDKFIERAGSAIDNIFKKPLRFIGTLIKAIGQGFKKFFNPRHQDKG